VGAGRGRAMAKRKGKALKAKYDGRCHACGRRFAAGASIVAIPPKGRRRRWLTRHVGCHAQGGGVKPLRSWRDSPWRISRPAAPVATRFDSSAKRPIPTDWPTREHCRQWMTDEEFAITEQAMAKRKELVT
jgi:hypothetical protein